MPSATRPAPLMTRLNLEWARSFENREHHFGSLGTRVCGELFEEICTSRGEAQDALLYELLVLARRGDKVSERVLVQVLIPAAKAFSYRVRTLNDLAPADRTGFAIGKAWEMIGRYPLHLRRRVRANLTMGVLGLLTPRKTQNQLVIADQTVPVEHDVLTTVAGSWESQPPLEVLAAKLFSWAVQTDVLSQEDAVLLARVSLGEEKQTDLAAEMGLSVDCVNKRVKRARARLRDAYDKF